MEHTKQNLKVHLINYRL